MSTAVGEKIKNFELMSHDGESISLQASLEKGPVVLAFFPLAFTGVCTTELCEFRDSIKNFEALKCQVFAISVDSRFSLAAFAKQNDLNFTLLSDFNKEVSKDFGVLYEEFLGMNGVSKRAVFVIDKSATVTYSWVTDNAGEKPEMAPIKEAVGKIASS